MHVNVSYAKWRPFCPGGGGDELTMGWSHCDNTACSCFSRLVSEMRAPLAACREPARELWQLCNMLYHFEHNHYDDVIMSAIVAHITSLTIVYSTVYPGADQSKHQSSASLASVCGIHRGPVNSPHKWPVTRKMFPFDDVIMTQYLWIHAPLTRIVVFWHIGNMPLMISCGRICCNTATFCIEVIFVKYCYTTSSGLL